MGQRKIGIVVPSYNQGRYLEQTILSILENKKNADIKLIIIDGGSTDHTVSLLNKYSMEIDYWQSGKDGGQSAAINIGMGKTDDCKYIMWLNSDDVYDSEYAVADIVAFAEERNAEICYGRSCFIDEWGNRTGIYPTRPFCRKRFIRECYISQPSVLIRRDIWDQMGGLKENLEMCMDYELWIRLAQKYQFHYFECFVGNTRMYGNTKTATNKTRHLNEAICIIDQYYERVAQRWIIEKFLVQHGIETKSYMLRRALRCIIWLWKKQIIRSVKEQIGDLF